MDNIVLTTFILGNNRILINCDSDEVEVRYLSSVTDIYNAKGRYISFIDSSDSVRDDYFSVIVDKIKQGEFDSCFINYKINYQFKRELKVRHEENELKKNCPVNDSYVWNYVFNKRLLLELVEIGDFEIDNSLFLDKFKNRQVISRVLYFHNKEGSYIKIAGMVNRREEVYYKNIVYVGTFCNGTFNGYITWLIQIGKAFDFDITILYDRITEITRKRFSKYFKCVEYNDKINYVCDNLISTYSTYFYPMNIYSLKENSLFIHGNMADYERAIRFKDDIYDRYIAVSKISQEKAKGYFPTDNIEYIYNPYTFDKSEIKPHLKLISAFRNAPEKGMDRVKKMAAILDEEKIPYTWLVFTDTGHGVFGGLLVRSSVTNIGDYLMDADYLVQFSKSEALSYSFTEALMAGVKIICTDIPAAREIGVVNGNNGFLVPWEAFDDNNKEQLRKIVLEAYKNKDMKFEYNYDYSKFRDYENVFSKNDF